jgi:hypothetical protein
MDLRKAILKEHTRAQASKIADYVGDNKALFNDLVDVYLTGPYRITQRAALPINICAERSPLLVIPHLKKLLDHLDKPGLHGSGKRNTIRLLQYVVIPERYRGRVAEVCFRYLQDKKEAIAVKVFSMSVLAQIARDEPGLKRELKLVIEDFLPYSSPAFISRAKKVLKELNKEPSSNIS